MQTILNAIRVHSYHDGEVIVNEGA
jgi:hypothetical protein